MTAPATADGVLRMARARSRSSRPRPRRMGIDRLRLIDTGLDPVTAEREQWDDGNNTLAMAPRLAVAYERNTETNAQLEEAGHRGDRDRRLRAGLRPGRPAVHVLPGAARPARLSPRRRHCVISRQA